MPCKRQIVPALSLRAQISVFVHVLGSFRHGYLTSPTVHTVLLLQPTAGSTISTPTTHTHTRPYSLSQSHPHTYRSKMTSTFSPSTIGVGSLSVIYLIATLACRLAAPQALELRLPVFSRSVPPRLGLRVASTPKQRHGHHPLRQHSR
jgi:hypothetical protein